MQCIAQQRAETWRQAARWLFSLGCLQRTIAWQTVALPFRLRTGQKLSIVAEESLQAGLWRNTS